MRVCQLKIGDEFSYYGVKYSVFSIDPPMVSILRIDGDNQVRNVTFLSLVTDSSFSPENSLKKRIDDHNEKNAKKQRAFLDSLPESKREEVTKRFEMIKPVLLYEKSRAGDFVSSVTFNQIYKGYLQSGETVSDISKEELLQRISNKYGKSVRQLKRYLAAYHQQENEYPNHGLDGLIRKNEMHKNQRTDENAIEICHPKKKEIVLDVIYTRLDKMYVPIMKSAIEQHYLTKRKISIANLHEIIEVMCYNEGLEPIDYNTVYYLIKKKLNPMIKEVLRKGIDAASEFLPTTRGFSDVAKAPLHIVEIDHTQLDIDVIDGKSGVNLGRPWITMGIDVFTRMIWCMHISTDAPSADKVRKGIQHGIFFKNTKEQYNTLNEWDIFGIPRIIYVDNGKEFKNAEVKRMIEETLQSQVMYRPIATPRYGAIIERVFGTINKKFIHRLAGTRKSNPTDLGEYNAEKEAIFTLENIQELLTTYITDVYHHDNHLGLPLEYPTPSARYYHALEVMGYPEFVPVEEEPFYRMELLPTTKKSYTRDGIRLDNIYYASQETSKLISKQKNKHKIKYDVDDISRIYVLDPSLSEYIEVPSHNPPANEIERMSKKIYKLLLKELRTQGKLNTHQIPGSRDIVKGKALLEEKMSKMIKSNKSVRQKALKAGFSLNSGELPKEKKVSTQTNNKLEILREQLNDEKQKKMSDQNDL
ncbi:hypothetical protein GCM10011351_26700 [Paraliobacillus quinghaiensis]|uniref:Integrase catalytic domain-containing protein n=1 Tax=Paraliobacillus quinghaiensis TaxID=470815 RepID=A0A917TVC7_9BACI|nr:Mu transposase C-terminal domain-containing protein [Paraliobacillus quinghaiensis]GGM39208.1 hypothetical protein GCM10011351_26700 [Paraliobacillus quinghaiensis]